MPRDLPRDSLLRHPVGTGPDPGLPPAQDVPERVRIGFMRLRGRPRSKASIRFPTVFKGCSGNSRLVEFKPEEDVNRELDLTKGEIYGYRSG